MKRLLHISPLSRIAAIVALLMIAIQASAMTYEQAREQALFLTDKMAYELNLSQEQYEAAYEINLDYLMSVTTVDEVYSNYWYQRNIDMEYIMLDWQYSAFCATNYFYRPLYWDAGFWHFGIYTYYPHRDVFYFERPAVYVSYRGGHGWRAGGGRSWYATRTTHYRGVNRGTHVGLRDHYDRRNGTDINRHAMSRTSSNINRQNMRGTTTHNGYRSSTRTTVGNNSGSSYRGSRSSRGDNDDMYSSGRSGYRGSDGSSSGSYSSGSTYNRHDYSGGSNRQSYGSGSNINRQRYGSSSGTYGGSSSSRSYGGSRSSSNYGGSSSSRSYGSSSSSSSSRGYSGSSSMGSRSSSSYGGSRSNISSFGGSSSMGSRSSGSYGGTRSSGSMSGGGSRGGYSHGSMSRH
ncbi:MAG: hypothetical protein IJ914_10155 [Prevotella sp.]|nr:hypothetical protein [Prevotella sp.]